MEETKPTKAIIEVDGKGVLAPKDFESQYRLMKAYVSSGLLPKQFDTPEKALVAYQFSLELGLKPLTAMRQIAIINGCPVVFGDLPMAMVLASGKCEFIREYFIDGDGREMTLENKNVTAEVAGAVCVSKRRDSSSIHTTIFTVEDAKFAKLWGRNVWALFPRRMLQMRARSSNLKDSFAECLQGIAIAEYDHNITAEVIGDNSKPIQTGRAAELNKMIPDFESNNADLVVVKDEA